LRVTDGATTFPVDYRGLAPDTFTDGVDVVVEGRLGRDGTFHATTLLAKCASRYENAPDGTAPNAHPASVPKTNRT
jgi:cytochrome c-type biogenesis protein CcmE